MQTPFFRGRRLRKTPEIRAMFRETAPLRAAEMIMPYFVVDSSDKNFRQEIPSMPGQFQLSLHQLEQQVAAAVDTGLAALMLFGIPKSKDPQGSEGYAEDGIVQQATRLLKQRWPQLQVVTDVCLCEYTSHGHCGLLSPTGEVLNDPTLELLSRVALSHVRAGADMVAPSDMMDGRIKALRTALDAAKFTNVPIMSYSVKYASAYYGPFRDAADSSPKSGDRKSYQMDPGNSREALREAAADLDEGADILMVKPAGPYMDIIHLLHDTFDAPLAAYQVSGEYSMIKAAALNGWINEDAVILESLTGIKRAGAGILINYFTEELLRKGLVQK
ncbi:MAG: porphobilinogen synthase [Desulfovibrionaceae bacterium]